MSYTTTHIDGKIAGLLLAGGVGCLPSDTIYGLSCRALDQAAVKKLHNIKSREIDKPFIILFSSMAQLKDLGIRDSDAAPALRYWPGALTIIVEAAKAPSWLTFGQETLAIRQPDIEQLRELMDKTGPLISTSANPAGEEPAVSAKEAQEYFGEKLDFYIDVGPLRSEPSTIIKKDFHGIHVIRQGSVIFNPPVDSSDPERVKF